MKLYFAPMEGITDGVYRRVFHEYFGGADKYFAPFLSPSGDFRITHREKRQLLCDLGAPYTVVPQLLVRETEMLAPAFEKLGGFGFTEINLNLGCPSGTVTAKGKGAGLLRDLDALRRLLDAAFRLRGDMRLSAKTRIGFASADEWPRIWDALRSYPFAELIVHPRTREEYYRGGTHPEAMETCGDAPFPVFYNGDVFSPADAQALEEKLGFLSGFMLGRGLVANPSLALELRFGEGLQAQKLKAFHAALTCAYAEEMPFQGLHGRMCEIVSYMSCCFENPKKALKAMRKARDAREYLERSELLFDGCPLKEEPYFDPLGLKV